MTVDVPPRYVVAPAALVYADLPRTIVVTGIRIWGLAWRHNYEYTGPIEEEDLLELLGLRRRQLFEHLRRLMSTGMLRYTTTASRFTFDFTASRSLSRGPPRRGDITSAVFRTGADMSVVVDEIDSSTDTTEKHQQQNARAREALEELGVMEPTLSEMLRLSWVTQAYLASWRAWYYDAEQVAVGVGFLVLQWRAGKEAPETRSDRDKRVRREQYARYNVQT